MSNMPQLPPQGEDKCWYQKSPCCASLVCRTGQGVLFCSNCKTILEWDNKYGKYVSTTYKINYFKPESEKDWDRVGEAERSKNRIVTLEDLYLHVRGELKVKRDELERAGRKYVDSIKEQRGTGVLKGDR